MSFISLLQASAAKRDTLVMAGIDPPQTPPNTPCHLLAWSKAVVDATKNAVCGYKPNAAFFEREGAEGLAALKELTTYIHETCGADMPVLIDAKRGDIGSTATAYNASIEGMFIPSPPLHIYAHIYTRTHALTNPLTTS